MAIGTDTPTVFNAAEEIFTSMLGLPLGVASSNEAPQWTGSHVMAGVGLVGEFSGTLLVECTGDMACRLAAALLGAECDEVDDDVKDMIGEIANMLAGNVSKELPGPPALTPPCVAAGTDYSMEFPNTQKVSREVFECEGHKLAVSLLKAN